MSESMSESMLVYILIITIIIRVEFFISEYYKVRSILTGNIVKDIQSHVIIFTELESLRERIKELERTNE